MNYYITVKHLLIIEDDETLRIGLCRALAQENISTKGASTLAEASLALEKDHFDLIILDCQLPDGNGVDFCTKIQQSTSTPVLFLTVIDSELNEVAAFRAGACDYVKKPFSLMVLKERVHAALARNAASPLVYHEEEYFFDFSALVFRVGGQEIFLSSAEQKLLQILIANRKQVVSREVLIDRLWSCDGDFIDENTLSVAVKRLRKKLDKGNGKSCIRTIYGLGYMWAGC